jgi:hypothetical protein
VGGNHEPSACKPHLIMLTRRAPVVVIENVAVSRVATPDTSYAALPLEP